MSVLLKVSNAGTQCHDQMQLGKEKVLFHLIASSMEVRTGAQGRNLEPGTDTEWKKNVAYLLALLAFSVSFLIYPEAVAQGRAEPSHLITDQENACRSVFLHTGQSYGSIVSVVAPSPKITITCVNSTKINKQQARTYI